MVTLAHPSNPLALAVLALLFERPMHPYEMAATLKQRHKGESIKIRYGSLYTVIELLVKRGLITTKETSREGKRPERTVFSLTPTGYDELRGQDIPALAEELPPQLVGKKFPPLFVVETEFALALIKAELAFVNELVRRITDEGWGPVGLWRELQAVCARQHEANGLAREGAM